jgi:outer membrane receptor protein involved in Fe transport
MTEDAYERNLAARAFDVARYVLFLGVPTGVGQVTSIRTLEAKSSAALQLTPYYELNLGASIQTIFYAQDLTDRRTIDERSNTNQYPDTTHTYRIEDAVDAADEHINAKSFKLAAFAENVLQLNEQLILNIGGRLDYFGINKGTMDAWLVAHLLRTKKVAMANLLACKVVRRGSAVQSSANSGRFCAGK